MIIKRLKKNTQGKDYVVGDLHGCYNQLMKQLQEINFDFDKDRLIAVGDLIDRGEDSLKCLELVFEPWFYSVRGNHCELMFDAILSGCKGSLNCWLSNGGDWIVDTTDDELTDIRNTILAIYESNLLPLAIEVDTDEGLVGIIHGKPPALWCQTMIRDTRQACLWSSSIGKEFTSKGIHKVYVGHRPTMSSSVKFYGGNVYYCDSGHVFDASVPLCITEI